MLYPSHKRAPTDSQGQTRKKMALLVKIVASFLILGGHPAIAEVDTLEDINVEFALTNNNGEVVGIESFRGSYVLLAFGFTSCAHICPLMATNMAKTIKAAEKDAVGIFVSIDTERDTPESTHNYANQFNGSMIGLGGTYSQVAEAAKNFSVSFAITKSEDSYTVQHTASIFLISPTGDLIDTFALNTPVNRIVGAMR